MSGNRGGKEQLLGASSAKNTFIRPKMDHYKDMGRIVHTDFTWTNNKIIFPMAKDAPLQLRKHILLYVTVFCINLFTYK